jgi:hypothetical protein
MLSRGTRCYHAELTTLHRIGQACVHYRSDEIEGLNLGESVAVTYLAGMRRCLTEDFDWLSLTAFNGGP